MSSAFRARARTAAVPLLGRCTFSQVASSLPCAVSGGADSLALLVLAFAAGCDPVAHHVDHGLRPGSAGEVESVRAVAVELGVKVVSHRVEVAPGSNLEARARSARRAVLPAGSATGHTADDQAETVLMNMLRGAATDGLAAMRPGPSHPILDLRRHETRALCDALEVAVVEDPSNLDPSFLRNQIRHDLLPMLCRTSGRDLVPVLCRQAALLGDDAAFLDELASSIDPTDPKALARAARPLARRAVRAWLSGEHPPDAATVERVLAVAAGEIRATEVGGSDKVSRRAGRLVLEHALPVDEAASSPARLHLVRDLPADPTAPEDPSPPEG